MRHHQKASSEVAAPPVTVNRWCAGSILAVRLLALIAALLGGYLAWVSFGGLMVVGCGAEPHCMQILRSRWAYWLGIPVSIPAVAVYGVLFTATFWMHGLAPRQIKQKAASVVFVCGVLIFGAAIWFLALQVVAIRRFCALCLIFHGLGLLTTVAVLAYFYTERNRAGFSENTGRVHASAMVNRWLPVLSVFILVVFVAGQILYRPLTHQVRPLTQETKVNVTTADRRELQILGGPFKVDLREVPIIGPPEAPYVIVALLDYTCQGCRILHGQLLEATKAFGDHLAVVCLLAPLDRACNPTVTEIYAGHTNACEYARIGLALWQADRRAHAQFEQWFFAAPSLPSPEESRRYIAQSVPGLMETQATSRGWVEAQILQAVGIYATVHAQLGRHAMPLLIIGSNVTMGSFGSSEELCRVLEKELALTRRGQPIKDGDPNR